MTPNLRTMLVALPALFCLAVALATAPAAAKNYGHGKHGNKDHGRNERSEDRDDHGRDDDDHHSVHIIHDIDAVIIRDYIIEHHHGHCPPGLAKKRHGCLPPGIAKKYAIGDVVHDGVWSPIPEELRLRLRPPSGHYYAMVDNDVVLIAEASKKIIDAVTLLSAVK